MALMPVTEARARLVAAARPNPLENAPLAMALGRRLGADVAALRTQPPFPASAMDGYAVRAADLSAGAQLRVVGESAAGRGYRGSLCAYEAVRIFTGAPVPDGADTILIQENVAGVGEAVITALQGEPQGRFVREAGIDFACGDVLLTAGTLLDARHLALAASMGHATLAVHARPRIAIIATGDELVRPGEPCGPDQIMASNSYALAALIEQAGGIAIDLGIARDSMASLQAAFDGCAGADAIVTLGGASVGDHDLVQAALVARGMTLDFWKIAMRPGKPLMFGRMGRQPVLGLPGNPVSSIVCGWVFVQPLVRALAGDDAAGHLKLRKVRLAQALPANDEREDYMRVTLAETDDGIPLAKAFPRQDSSMLARLTQADALLVRPPHAPRAAAGDLAQALVINPEF